MTRLTTCKDWSDKDHENWLLEKAKEWHRLIGVGGAHEPAEFSWQWLLLWAAWRAGDVV